MTTLSPLPWVFFWYSTLNGVYIQKLFWESIRIWSKKFQIISFGTDQLYHLCLTCGSYDCFEGRKCSSTQNERLTCLIYVYRNVPSRIPLAFILPWNIFIFSWRTNSCTAEFIDLMSNAKRIQCICDIQKLCMKLLSCTT